MKRILAALAATMTQLAPRFIVRFITRIHLKRRQAMGKECSHLKEVHTPTPSASGCEECLKTGSSWVHLRLCETCGHVGCCDSSEGKHATKHFHATHHPVMRSFQPGESWRYCYVDEETVE